ncbi:MAG: penicillin-binding protein 1C [Acidimicrobiales bacterium]|nr:penicillin-binding protein 1C [Arenicellales bacterium]MDP7481455.1 penicillin-binding protein 1C [Arenicellales bacterium]MEE1522887.1 penicillin-binding protein 1C [Acidimicrobiales bacterium]MEE1570625.1 penicillin-binding protein 1C [Acidimicrobiales bacterium]HJP25719.1 penicillin-binding protein 1C [Arenicellales bacterium]
MNIRSQRAVPIALSLAGGVILGPLLLIGWLYLVDNPIDTGVVSWSTVVTDREERDLHLFLAEDERYRLKSVIERIDPLYFRILLAHEDRRFHDHSGVDWPGMVRAFWQLVANGRLVSGGSTLTMQTAKLLDPAPRTIASKLNEMQRAITLERRFNKEQILTLYTGLTPYGGNVEGIEMGSRAWFGKPPLHLTPAEAALLVALPQSPEWLRPDRHPNRAQSARNRILRVARDRGVLSDDEMHSAMLSPIPTQKHPPPRIAHHLAWRVKGEGERVQTTLDHDLQQDLERIALDTPLPDGTNLAILIADAPSGELLGYVGSKNYFNSRNAGAFDFATAVRSPGSTLKPFIYGLAESLHLIHPNTLITDEPVSYAGYRPENLDYRFRGEITAADALRLSLNIPAVKVLDRLSPGRFTSSLEQAGIVLENGKGLPIALGGAGLTLEKLVELYTALAREGEVQPIGFLMGKEQGKPRRLLDKTSTRHINWALAKTGTPAHRLGGTASKREIAFKTGTGPGGSDALAIGTDGRYIIGVWTGTVTGEPLPGNRGLRNAAPLLHRLFDRYHEGELKLARPDKAPPLLARLESSAQDLQRLQMEILFPASGTTIKQRKGRSHIPLTLKNASYPIVRTINGSRLEIINNPKELAMTITQPGTYRLSLVDRNGASGRSVFNVLLYQP